MCGDDHVFQLEVIAGCVHVLMYTGEQCPVNHDGPNVRNGTMKWMRCQAVYWMHRNVLVVVKKARRSQGRCREIWYFCHSCSRDYSITCYPYPLVTEPSKDRLEPFSLCRMGTPMAIE